MGSNLFSGEGKVELAKNSVAKNFDSSSERKFLDYCIMENKRFVAFLNNSRFPTMGLLDDVLST